MNAFNAYIVRSEQLFLWTVYLKIAKLFLTHIEKPVDTHNRKTVQKAWLSHTYFPNFFQKILNEEFRELTICELKHILNTPWNRKISSITWISWSKTCIFLQFVDIKRYYLNSNYILYQQEFLKTIYCSGSIWVTYSKYFT